MPTILEESDIWGSHSHATGDSHLLGCDTASLRKKSPKVSDSMTLQLINYSPSNTPSHLIMLESSWRNTLPLASWHSTMNVEAVCCSGKLTSTYHTTWSNNYQLVKTVINTGCPKSYFTKITLPMQRDYFIYTPVLMRHEMCNEHGGW